MKISTLYELFKKNPKIVTDTRKIVPDSIFFALKGANFDGNAFAKKALSLGAKYAIIDDVEIAKTNNSKLILVNNVLKTLQQLASFHRKNINIPIIGITGTNGKTTTKELLNKVLQMRFKTLSTKGNFNNHIGVPLTLLSIKKEHEIAIIEMGANHPGEIADLCEIVQPNFGVVTNVGLAHLEGFKSYENIVTTKSALYNSVFNSRGTNFLLSENENLKKIFSKYSFKEYSIKDNEKEFYGYGSNTKKGLTFHLKKLNGKEVKIDILSKLTGIYNESNILAAICIGYQMGIKIKDIATAIENYKPSNNRSQIKKTKKNTLILDAYNANPSSVTNALCNFKKENAKNKTIILGDMFELGSYEEEKHQEIIELINKLGFENVILIGKAFSNTKKHFFKCFENTNNLELESLLKSIKNHTVLVKGSRGMRLENLIEFL